MSPEPAAAPLTVPDLLRHRARVQPDGVAFVVDGATELTYEDWEKRSNALAHRLLAGGAGRGERIGLYFGGMEWIEYAVAYFAVLKSGATAVHLNADQPAAELDRRISVAAVSRLVHAPDRTVPAGWAGPALSADALDGADRTPPPVAIAPEDLADVVFTSGTTGPAKAYTIPHGNAVFGRRPDAMDAFGSASYLVTTLQLATGSSASALNIATISKVVTVFAPPDDIDRGGQLIEKYRAGMVAITPWIANQMVLARLHETYDLSSVGMFACGSAPLPPARARQLLEMVPGARITSACSQSEASPALCVNVFDPEHPMSVGRPTPITELRVVDEEGADLPTGRVGEIWLRHPAPKRLYLGLPEVNERITADGWYRTGDLGHLDDEGRVHFFDRRADAVPTAGGPVSTPAVEAALYEHPAVREAAAFGIPAGAAVQQVAAAVVLDPAQDGTGLEEHLAARLDPGRRPVRVVTLDALPRNAQNKVLKRELRERFG
ncbi:AMP-binding protein [Streptomyces sp. SID486]|uniref:class I adenylate-forming enzyme family protein n=1 Tax=Streptomyces sp. SID486 TaxID=2690264 RepID=UPI00137097DC|nr:class I adenylate-forming enzyme family protein [Streptomyces sp. SID486]MYX96618.1 AMP-binding protein [Streptomyces sp. SID486]